VNGTLNIENEREEGYFVYSNGSGGSVGAGVLEGEG
jgi:hypothetical protein